MTDDIPTMKVPDCETEIEECPNGCSFGEIEIGKEGQSFMAMIGSPHLYICCGECDFNRDEGKSRLAFNTNDAVIEWNKAAECARGIADTRHD